MIHQYKLGGYHVVLDVCSGSVHVVDEVAYEIIAMFENSPRETVLSAMAEKFAGRADITAEDIAECYEQVAALKESGKLFALTFGGATVLFALYLLMGYLLRWTHYFCSIQSAYHIPMTPENVDWSFVKKSDAYGIPAMFAVPGIVMIVLDFVF